MVTIYVHNLTVRCPRVSLGCVPRSGFAESYGKHTFDLKNSAELFSSVLIPVYKYAPGMSKSSTVLVLTTFVTIH